MKRYIKSSTNTLSNISVDGTPVKQLIQEVRDEDNWKVAFHPKDNIVNISVWGVGTSSQHWATLWMDEFIDILKDIATTSSDTDDFKNKYIRYLQELPVSYTYEYKPGGYEYVKRTGKLDYELWKTKCPNIPPESEILDILAVADDFNWNYWDSHRKHYPLIFHILDNDAIIEKYGLVEARFGLGHWYYDPKYSHQS